MKGVEAPPIGGLVRVIVIVIVVLVGWWLVLAWAIVKRPILAIPTVIFVALVVLVGMHDAQALAIYLLGALWIWRRAHRESFDRLLGRRVRSGWRRWWVYERSWRNTMLHTSLAKRGRLRDLVPKIEAVQSNGWCDRVRVRLLLGQCTEDYEKAAPSLAHSFGAESCRVREDRPGRLWLQFATGDPLAEPVAALPVAEPVDLEAVPVGVGEDGDPWRVQVLYTHVLIAGATGSGKGSVLQSLIRALGSEIRDGRVQLWVIDPKRMELGPGRALYARFAVPTFDDNPYEQIAVLLEDAVEVLRRRTEVLERLGVRKHTPTREEPLIVVVIDELGDLTKYVSDRETKARITRARGLLLTQGRSVAISVIGALQDPRMEALPDRNLFPTRIALRLDEPGQVDLVLGDGARDRGALCDQIRTSQPGVGYMRVDGDREPTKFRAAYPTNDDIAQLAADYAPRRLDGEQLFQAAEADVDAEVIEITRPRAGEQPEDDDGRREAS